MTKILREDITRYIDELNKEGIEFRYAMDIVKDLVHLKCVDRIHNMKVHRSIEYWQFDDYIILKYIIREMVNELSNKIENS